MRMRGRTILMCGIAVLVVALLVGFGVVVATSGNGGQGQGGQAATGQGSGDNGMTQPSTRPSAQPKRTAKPQPTELPATPSPTPAYADYIALGDSYAAGMGSGDETGRCRRSPNAYPHVLDANIAFSLQRTVACSGATTADVQRFQLSALSETTDLVTLTVGGNDLNVAGLSDACARGVTTKCPTMFRKSLTPLNVLPDRLRATFRAVAKAPPNARIVVTGYPLMFKMPATDSPEFTTIAVANAATASLDQIIKNAVKKKRSDGLKIQYVAVDFAGYEIGDKTPWINATGRDAFHPTAAGSKAIAQTIEKALKK
jgi:lysophospholipase L1-like esterase